MKFAIKELKKQAKIFKSKMWKGLVNNGSLSHWKGIELK